MSMKNIGIIGSRRRDVEEDYIPVRDKFFEVYEIGDIIVSGGCKKGGDRFAEIIAQRYEIPITIFYPEPVPSGSQKWKYAKANYDRNTLVAEASDIIIACVADDRRGGTEDTLKKFKKLRPEGAIHLV
jgi:hypothetical protein